MTTSSVELDFLLPGDWSTVPLDEGVGTKRAIRALALRTLGRADELASVRAEFRQELEQVASRARELNGSTLHTAREIVTGVPLPATLVVCWPDVPAPRGELERADWEAGLLDAAVGGESEAVELGEIRAVRRIQVREESVVDDPDSPVIHKLEVDYWMVLAGRVSIFTFASGAGHVRDHLVPLFDAIVATVRPATSVTV
jgi:hypothetical protein